MLNVSLEHSFKSNLNIKNLNVCFDKKKLYLKQTNIIIEMVICVTVKVITGKGRPKVL